MDVILSVTDLSGLGAVDTLNIQIENINSAPVLTEIGDQVTDEDVSLDIVLSAIDMDGDILTFTAESDNEDVDVSVDGTVLTLTPADNYNGSGEISGTANDGIVNANTETFIQTVDPVNDVPLLT